MITLTKGVAQSASSPSVKFCLGENVLDATKGVAAADLPQLKIKVVPDSQFANDKFVLRSWSMFLRRGQELGSPIEGSGEALNLVNSIVSSGDVIVVEVHTVLHTDANGKSEKVTLTTENKYLTIPIK